MLLRINLTSYDKTKKESIYLIINKIKHPAGKFQIIN